MNTLKDILSSSYELCDRINSLSSRLGNIIETLAGPSSTTASVDASSAKTEGILSALGQNHSHLHTNFQRCFEMLNQIEQVLGTGKNDDTLEVVKEYGANRGNLSAAKDRF